MEGKYGLLGEKLGHSYSPAIHALLGDYDYKLYECPKDKLDGFLTRRDFAGLNVTIPYKKAVIPYCAQLSPIAAKLGSVNVLIHRKDGTLYGDNTDAYGFSGMVAHSGIAVAGKKVLVLGSGGASATVCAVLEQLGAASVTVISRSGENNYNNLDRHGDTDVIVNTTPVGMYPNNGVSPLDLKGFPRCSGVLDILYNPARTALMLQAEELGIPCAGGLYMLVAQAKRTAELFLDTEIADGEIVRIRDLLARQMQNIVLIGMPGCGKTTAAALLGKKLGRPVSDSDAAVEQAAGKPIPQIFAEEGQDAFRALETQALAQLGKGSAGIIATGGGCVTRRENYPPLHQNGVIFWLRRDTDRLPREDRPISLSRDLKELEMEREPLYRAFADHIIDNNGPVEDAVRRIMEVMG